LYQDGNAKGIHGEACSIDLDTENVHDTLSFRWIWSQKRFERGGREGGRDGWWCSLAWCLAVGEEHAVLARELFECNRYEGTDSADYKDLGVLVEVWGALVEHRGSYSGGVHSLDPDEACHNNRRE
jgi:hypothetical protein